MRPDDFIIQGSVDPTEIHQVKVMLASRSWKILARMFKNQALCSIMADPSPVGEARANALYEVATLDRDRFDDIVHSEALFAPLIVDDEVPEA